MNTDKSVDNISKAILDYIDKKETINFVQCILSKLHDSNDSELFKEVWSTSIDFDNWNNENITIGFEKTKEILLMKYNLDSQICTFLANRASFEWK